MPVTDAADGVTKKKPVKKVEAVKDEDPKNVTEPRRSSRLSKKPPAVKKVAEAKKVTVPKKVTAPKKVTVPKKASETKVSENQIIKVEIQGVKMEFELKPDQGLAGAKITEASKPKKKKIPKNVKIDSWNHWIGKSKGESKCLCCEIRDIGQNNFECGHIVSEKCGGAMTISNLKPICGTCNKSMGTRNMDEFKREHYPSKDEKAEIGKRNAVQKLFNVLGMKNCQEAKTFTHDEFQALVPAGKALEPEVRRVFGLKLQRANKDVFDCAALHSLLKSVWGSWCDGGVSTINERRKRIDGKQVRLYDYSIGPKTLLDTTDTNKES